MKKTTIIILTVSFLLLFNSLNIKAKTNPYFIRNILDLSNIAIYENPEESSCPYYFKSIEHISLNVGETFTFVISKEFFDDRGYGQESANYETFYTFIDPTTNKSEGKSNQFTITKDYAYISFVAVYSLIELREIPFEIIPTTPNMDIMLYQGDISLFNGEFTSYKSQYNMLNWVYLKDYDEELNLDEIISSIGVLNSKNTTYKVIIDDYSNNKDKTGEFDVILMAVSESNNKSFLRLIVKNTDITAPVFIGDNTYTIEIGEDMPTIADLIYELELTDNYSPINNNNIVILSDTYSIGKNRVGVYKAVLEAEDQHGNKTIFELNINVVDTIAPVIVGPREIFRYSTDPVITIEQIKKLFTVTDNVDEDLNDRLLVSGTSDKSPGVYEYTLTVADFSGNTSIHKLLVNVLDGNTPVFTDEENYIITYSKYKSMDHQQIKEWILRKNKNMTNIEILLDETIYLKDKDEPMHIYYSYKLNNKICYGRIIVSPSNEKQLTNIIIMSSLVLINIVVFVSFIKRPKIHL